MKLRELILLRHAHAVNGSPGSDDAIRPLSPQGEAEADAAGQWLASRPLPQRVVCSPSTRTRETLARVLAATGYLEQRSDDRIYEATPGELLDVVADHADCETLMLVGHNPGFEALTALLSTGQSGDHRGMPPGGVAVLGFEAGADVAEPGSARLVAFWSP